METIARFMVQPPDPWSLHTPWRTPSLSPKRNIPERYDDEAVIPVAVAEYLCRARRRECDERALVAAMDNRARGRPAQHARSGPASGFPTQQV
jgi:hypothetical protein